MKSLFLLSLLQLLHLGRASVKVTNEGPVSASGSDLILLGSTCFGFSKDPKKDHIGMIHVSLHKIVVEKPNDLVVLTYDDQEDSYPSLTSSMSCEEKMRKAKNYEEVKSGSLFNVTFNLDGQWLMPRIPIVERSAPRQWYVTLSNCQKEEFAIDSTVSFDYDGSLYVGGTGPSQCKFTEDGGEAKNYFSEEALGELNGLTAVVVLTCLLILVLLGALAYQCFKNKRQARQGNSIAMDDFDEAPMMKKGGGSSDDIDDDIEI